MFGLKGAPCGSGGNQRKIQKTTKGEIADGRKVNGLFGGGRTKKAKPEECRSQEKRSYVTWREGSRAHRTNNVGGGRQRKGENKGITDRRR